YYPYVENIFHNGITVGCGVTTYCPGDSTTRAQMAVFLLKSKYGAAHVPPLPTGAVFGDVPADHPYAAWIEELASGAAPAGGGGGDGSPDGAVPGQGVALFLAKTAPTAAFVPPAAAGIFGDVPPGDQYAPWIEDLYGRQITAGCDGQTLNYCPGD